MVKIVPAAARETARAARSTSIVQPDSRSENNMMTLLSRSYSGWNPGPELAKADLRLSFKRLNRA
jgi:hypothetical protein